MKFEIDKDNIVHVSINDIVSVSVTKGTNYNGSEKKEEFYVELAPKNGMIIRALTTSYQDKANKMRDIIGEKLDSKKPEQTYLDGFKEGTEYALKLMESRGKNNV